MKQPDYFFNIEDLEGPLDWIIAKLHLLQDFSNNDAVIKVVYAEKFIGEDFDIPLGYNIYLNGDK